MHIVTTPTLWRLALLISMGLASVSLHAAGDIVGRTPEAEDYRRLNLALVDHHVLPRHQQFAARMVSLEEAGQAFCSHPDLTTLKALRTHVQAGADAWQAIQHIRFGPVELFMRGMRVWFWPDPRNSIERQLDSLLTSGDMEALDAVRFSRATIAVQGLPALELLVMDAALERTTQAPLYCAVLGAITANLRQIANDIVRDWTEGDTAFRTVISMATTPNSHYPLDREATQDFLMSLVTSLEMVAEHKLARPLGPSVEAARPALAESWRTGRSLDHLRTNLAAAEALYLGEGSFGFSALVREIVGDGALDALLKRAFAQTRASADAISLPLEKAITDPQARHQVEKLVREARALKALLSQRLAPAIGIQVGFNSLDGD